MGTFKKKELNELVGGDVFSSGGDRNVTNDSEIETGPVQKPYHDDSPYEKGRSVTTDKVFGQYRQNIPWFAVYSFGGTRTGTGLSITNEANLMTKKTVEEKIDDLVKKSRNTDLTEKGYNSKVEKIADTISGGNFSEEELEKIKTVILDKLKNPSKTKNL